MAREHAVRLASASQRPTLVGIFFSRTVIFSKRFFKSLLRSVYVGSTSERASSLSPVVRAFKRHIEVGQCGLVALELV
jgi:hypothetical protein